MNQYLLDTNICIYYLKGKFDLQNKINKVGLHNCFISEITLAELKFGVENSLQIDKNRQMLNNFQLQLQIIPIFTALDIFASEKARLKQQGTMIDDFDLLIGATALANSLIMVTNNHKHLSRISGIRIEDWTI